MKKLIFIIVIMISSLPALAQVVRINNGLSISTFSGKTEHDDRALLNYSGGIGLDYLNKDYYFLNSEVNFIRKGERYYDNISPVVEDALGFKRYSECLDYVSVSTSVNGKLPLGKFVPFIGMGLRGDFLISNSIRTKGERYDEYSMLGTPRHAMIGVVLNAGFLFDFQKWDFGFRYSGLLDFLSSYSNAKHNAYTQTIDFTIGIKLRKSVQ
ncbi:MAG: hypothetical protein IJ270_05755 [Paludibacteraceae bacterium]|nr:hypothetical protein [Paludibacteraceae bacterium]